MVILTLCSSVQAPIQCALRPSMWVPGLKSLHVHREKWRIDQSAMDFVETVKTGLATMIQEDQLGTFYDVHKIEKNFVRIFAFTWAEWLDIVEIKLVDNHAEVVSFSSGLLPLSIPFACFINVALFWFPFYGHKFNITRLEKLRTAMGVTISVQDQ
ncbi:uncharacterized protein LOC125380103 isoform X1 [Haliotis rufescens]|uniref:uncharacterized protein LOC125380103 isoform X1 n=1 Tax=Haliotis rufescens TaxID=6454 RepID=UPI00201ECB4A|nr:uncharacterized protein LOC125380103 isoform X1 [Haliotis rufescens]XP_048252327.1 uncharacterized protein LOC125380103 isoform X1 [Haliotis rufescens]